MVDRKLYSRSRQKALLNRVVDEELYKPDDSWNPGRGNRGIAELLMRERVDPAGQHRRHRLSDLLGEDGPPPTPVALPRRRPGFWQRALGRLASLLPRSRS